ncbi:MAG: sensor histidine kinase [Clostridia bacterium]|nr:sensor histidine kinase [Clostridia bacterium]
MNSDALFSLYTLHIWIITMAFIGAVLYQANFLKTLCVSILYMVLLCASDLFGLAVIELLFGAKGLTLTVITKVGSLRTAYSLTVKILLVIFYFVAFRKNKKYEFEIKTAVGLSVYGYFFFSGLQSMVNSIVTNSITDMRRSVLLSLVFVMLFMVSVFVMLSINSKLKQEKLENRIITTRIEVLENNNKQLNDAYKEIAKMSHDYGNQFRMVTVMAQNGRFSELAEYLCEIKDDFKSVKILSYTAIDSIDAAINIKVHAAESKNIAIDVSASYPGTINVRHVDICAVIVNLLDNAIEACEKIEDAALRYIKLSITSIGEMIVIKVENSHCEKLPEMYDTVELQTTKPDSHSHGYGMQIVDAIAKKYNGSFEINYKENTFAAIAMLTCDS